VGTIVRDVTVHITPNDDGSFLVTGTATGTRRGGGALDGRACADETALRRFLSSDLGIHRPEVNAAVEAVRAGETYSIPHVMLTGEQIHARGLGPI
jgi:hypothetical protein